MRDPVWKLLLIYSAGVALIILITLLATGCSSTKQVQKVSVDSTYIKELEARNQILSSDVSRLTTEVNELQYGFVRFDTVYLPGDTVVNTVTITKEGEIKATGRVSTAYVSKNLMTRIIAEKERIIDSLSTLKQKETVRVVTEYKDKYVKRSFLNFWWLLLIGAAGGYYLSKKIKL